MLRYTRFLLIVVLLLAVSGMMTRAASTTPKVPATGIGVSSGAAPSPTSPKAPAQRNPAIEKTTAPPPAALPMEHVLGGAWVAKNIEGHFQVNPDITDRTYRLMVIADPDQTLLDPNRSNNRATVPFRLPD